MIQMENDKRKKYKIAFVCTGNTCRSPMAQFIMRAKLKEAGVDNVTVKSFGLNAHGSPMKDNAKYALKCLKIKFTEYTSKPMPKNLKSYDAVVCMTSEHKQALSGQNESLYTFGELCGVGDVPDPYGKDEAEYLRVAKILYGCCEKLTEYIKRINDENSDR